MKKKSKFLVFSVITVLFMTNFVFASSNKTNADGKDKVDVKTEVKDSKKKESVNENKESKAKTDVNGKQKEEKENPEDLVYNIVVAKNGSITTDHISEATYNGIMEILEDQNKKGNTYKTIDQDNTIILHESYGFKLSKEVEREVMAKYSSKLPNIDLLIKNNSTNKEEKTQRNKKLLFLGVILWLSLNGIPSTNEVIRKERD